MVEAQGLKVKSPELSHGSDDSGNTCTKCNSPAQNSSQTLNSVMFMKIQRVLGLPRTMNIFNLIAKVKKETFI